MRIGDMFPSKYLAATDLADGRGGYRRVRVQIESVTMAKVGDEVKPVAHFHGKSKALVINRTAAIALQKLSGSDDSDDWTDLEIALYVDPMVQFGRKTVPAIRVAAVREREPVRPPRAAAPSPRREREREPETDREPGADDDEIF